MRFWFKHLPQKSGSESGSKEKTRPTTSFLTVFTRLPEVRFRSPALIIKAINVDFTTFAVFCFQSLRIGIIENRVKLRPEEIG